MKSERARVISVGGGKGGVGKSFVSVNLAVSIARMGKRVVMLDADLGGANLHTLFGVMRPDRTVHDFIDGRTPDLADVAIQTEVPGLSILCGTCDILGSGDLDAAPRRRLVGALRQLDTDVLLIDVGAGTSGHTLDIFNAADTRIVVMSPELTAAQNAYGFVKSAVYRRMQRALDEHPAAERLKERLGEHAFETGSRMEKMSTFLSLVASEGLGLEDPFKMLLREFNAKLIGNMLASDADRNVVYGVKRMMEGFLGLEVEVAAAFRSSSKVRTSVNSGRPLVAMSPPGTAPTYDVAEFQRLARCVADQDLRGIHALRAAIADALSSETRVFAFGLDGVDVVELAEVTDPEELAAIEAAEAAARAASLHPAPAAAPTQADPPPAATSRAPSVVPMTQATPSPASPAHARPTSTMPVRAAVRDAAGPWSVPAARDDVGRARFASELDRVKRRTTRGVIHVEVQVAGQWFFGKLVEADLEHAVVSGVHPFFAKPGAACALRVVAMNEGEEAFLPDPVRVVLGEYDEPTGRTRLRFAEPGLAPDYVRLVALPPPSVRPRAA